MDNGFDEELAQRFINDVVVKYLRASPSDNAREFKYFAALADAMGEGESGFYSVVYGLQSDLSHLVDTYLKKPTLDADILMTAAQQWFANETFEDIRESNIAGPLSQKELEHWHEQGYVIVKGIIDTESSLEVADWVMNYIGMDLSAPSSWYKKSKGNIMVEAFANPMLDRAGKSPKAFAAFQQLWGAKKLIRGRDRVSVNVPENEHHKFHGPHLHVDVNFDHPHYFSTQGILYLNDVAEDQGAFTLCPGFHHQYQDWIASLPKGQNPNETDFYQFPHKPIAANAGDLIIWNQWLPHGASANKNTQPRIAQYLNVYSLETCFV